MSKGLKLGIAVLVLILVALAGIAGLSLMQKQSLENQLTDAQNKVADSQNKVTELSNKISKYQQDMDKLGKELDSKSRDAAQAQSALSEIQHKFDDTQAQVDQITKERDDWKARIDTISHERDELVSKLKEQTDKAAAAAKVQKTDTQATADATAEAANAPGVTTPQGEDYWAGVLKQKAALQLELEKTKGDLDQSALQIVDLKKQNSDLQLQVKEIKDDKEDIERKIKYGEDLANSLSVELARSHNDQKFTNDRADKLKEQNLQLQDQLRQLMTTKVALERTVAHLNDDKAKMQSKLSDTENVIQGRINEIWQIKETLDQKISNMPDVPKPTTSSVNVELPPIVVNTSGMGNAPSDAASSTGNTAKTQGKVLSINTPNNFVIIDMGQSNSNLKVGHILKVTRDGNDVATLEVIQVRRDISAADIKQKTSDIKVGDIVKAFN